jgi:adenylate cyclase
VAYDAPVSQTPSPDAPLVYLVMDPGGVEVPYAVYDRLFIGRDCAGIGESRRVLIERSDVSRSHCELCLDAAGDRAYLVDESTNGTRHNGVHIPLALVERPSRILAAARS